MGTPSTPFTEAVKQLEKIGTGPEDAFDAIAQSASAACEAPAAAIVFTNGSGGWVKASHGTALKELPDFHSLLFHPERGPQLTISLQEAQEWANHSLFAAHGFKFYTGIPLTTPANIPVGHLCILDYIERSLTDRQLRELKALGTQAQLLLHERMRLDDKQDNRREVKLNREQMRSIFYNAVDAVVITNYQNTIIQWNPKAETIFGWPADEIIGKNFVDLCIAANYRQQYLDNKGHQGKHIEITGIHKNGTEPEINAGLSFLTIDGNEYNVAFITDVTERNKTTYKLDKQKAFYENILNKLPTDIAVFDANHRYLFVNPGAISNEEYRKYIIGKDDYEYAAYRNRDVSVAHARRAQFLQVKEKGQEIRWEDSLPNPEGKVITHLRRMFPVHDETGELSMVIGFGMDITDRKEMEEKQSALVKQLSAQNAQLIDFCNIVSHNLRGPLVNMSMLVDFINESEDSDEQKFLVSKLKPVIDNLHTTFNELVESIQIKQNWEVQSEKLNLNEHMLRAIKGLEMEITKTGAVIDANFDEAPAVIYPPKYLTSIFQNLIENSLKYRSPERSPVIRIATKKQGASIILSVSDNGLGIDTDKHKDNLFKIGKVFHRHPNAKGFGLFMTKTQIEAMGGDIWIESAVDEGATFFVEFKNQTL